MSAITSPPFDRVAASYDALWTTTAVGRAQRDQVWRAIDPLFHTGDRILDIGCGTGEDAAHFAARGVVVDATDASPAMVRLAQARGGFTATACRAEDLARIDGRFDGAISNFGALNCVGDLHAVAASLAGLVRPGGRVAICLLGRYCAWEAFYYGVRGSFAKAMRRWAGHASACPAPGVRMVVHYPSVSRVRDAFAPDFKLWHWTGVGLFVPPSYVKVSPAVIGAFAACDRFLARALLLRGLADHRLFILVRR